MELLGLQAANYDEERHIIPTFTINSNGKRGSFNKLAIRMLDGKVDNGHKILFGIDGDNLYLLTNPENSQITLRMKVDRTTWNCGFVNMRVVHAILKHLQVEPGFTVRLKISETGEIDKYLLTLIS